MKPARVTHALLAAGAAVFALSWSGGPPDAGGGFMSRAEAIRGRPLTPMSYAGVARRTTRRAVAYGTAAGAAAATAYPPDRLSARRLRAGRQCLRAGDHPLPVGGSSRSGGDTSRRKHLSAAKVGQLSAKLARDSEIDSETMQA
jgi:hypothetical protein